ncbi:MAG: type I restriction enzyme M protein [bacterium]|jgi:type I restriction enzyme M protein
MQKLDLQTLESWLWESANILRGSIDSSDFKNYIFGIIFLKRFNDVFEERVEDILEKEKDYDREEAIDDVSKGQRVPEVALWKNITTKTEGIGEALDKAFLAIEEVNTTLENVLTATPFGDKNKLSDEVLQLLLKHFNKYNLGNKSLYKEDLLGDAYEFMIKMFADDAGKKGGEFYTPKGVVNLLVQILDPKPEMTIYDPTEGSGGMLLESARYIAEQENGTMAGGAPNCHLAGQEKNLGTWAIAKLNLYLHNIDSSQIKRGDTRCELITTRYLF